MIFQPVAAQDKPAKGPSFRIACWSEWTKDELFIRLPRKVKGDEDGKGKGKMLKLEILDMSYSPSYPYTPGEPLLFFKKTDDEKEPYAPELKVLIPNSYKDPLVMLMLGKEKTTHFVYDLNTKNFPFGSYKVINFSSVDLFTELAGKRFALKPKSSHMVNLSLKEKKAIQCKVAVKQNGKAKLVYSSMLMNRPNKRMLMFFFPTKDEAGRSTIKCRSLVDFATTPAKTGN